MSEELTPIQFYPLKFQVKFKCNWKQCSENFNTHEELYFHLTDKHVGRKVLNNLCLKCSWNDCDQQFTKRDHITSHLKIHVAFKPFPCNDCPKSFKRAHDLKKHQNRVHSRSAHSPYMKSKSSFSDYVRASPNSSESSPEFSNCLHLYSDKPLHLEDHVESFRDTKLEDNYRRIRFYEENQFTTTNYKF